MVSTIACVAVALPTQIAVVYDSCFETFSDPNEFTLQPHHDLFAVDQRAVQFLNDRQLSCRQVYRNSFLKSECWGCGKDNCLITMAFLAWRLCLKRRRGVTLEHNTSSFLDLKSPRTQEIFLSVGDFNAEDNPTSGCAVADNGYVDGDPSEWLPRVMNSDTVLTAIGPQTTQWLKARVPFPIKTTQEIELSYPCRECDKTNCSMVKAFYGWKGQAVQTSCIQH